MALEEAHSHSGGIWVLMNHSQYKFDVLYVHHQVISLSISFANKA